MTSVSCKFISRKTSKIRWRPSHSSLKQADTFVTGSWDDQENKVCVWQIPTSKEKSDCDDLTVDDLLLSEQVHAGDVTDLQFINQDNFITGSSNGSITQFKLSNLQSWVLAQKWENVHTFPTSPCTCSGVSSLGDNIVSVGEDGRIAFIKISRKEPDRIIDKADSCSLTSVDYVKHHEVITANMRGQLKIWDTRSQTDKPSRIFHVSGDVVSVQCVTHHPTQPQVIATGQEDGMLCIWDMRHDKNPVTLLQAHNGPVMEVKFHPTSPDHLFTCSIDGSVWHWDGTALSEQAVQAPKHRGAGKENEVPNEAGRVSNPWLQCDAAKHRLDIYSLIPSSHLPINSLDVDGNTLLCGSDNEALYMVKNLKL